jgi:MutS-like protein
VSEQSTKPLEFYERRVGEIRVAYADTDESADLCRITLVVLALITCVAAYESFIAKNLPLWAAAVAVPFAIYFAERAARCKRKLLSLSSLLDYYEKGVARLKRDWKPLDEGASFRDSAHFYSSDLDLFGSGSLFQLLCSARTQTGRVTLANWMRAPASREEALARRAAIEELRPRTDIREALASAGSWKMSNCEPETFREWVNESTPPFPVWAAPAAFLLALVAVALPILFWTRIFDLHTLGLATRYLLLAEALIGGLLFQSVKRVSESITSPSAELPRVRELLKIMERENFTSSKLISLVSRLNQNPSHASSGIRRLQRLVYVSKLRDDPSYVLFVVPSYVLMWGTQFAIAIDGWRRGHGVQLLEWLTVIGEFEALVSIAGYSFEHPNDVWPELMEAGPVLRTTALAHPLLDESSCVANDLHLDANLRFLIVSGSNMSGKSTFLRAVGLNAVLAWMGAPVRCASLQISPLAIGAAIRVEDSLIDGRSHFLAEMQRLRGMIETAGEGPLLFLADEIMSGTNSQDRRIAAEWVVRALILRGAIGLITTHDLALTEIASNGLPGGNAHFEDSGEAGELSFDYKLRPGLLTRSNALNIARMLGIDTAAKKL